MLHRLRAFPFCALLAMSPMLFSCADIVSSNTGDNGAGNSLDAGENNGASDDTEPASEQVVVTSAMVLTYGRGGLLFVSDESGTYFPGLDNAEIIGIDGSAITAADLVAGNKVSVTGDGIMLESWPGQYLGISKVEVTDEGSPEDVAEYADLINEIYIEPSPSEPPNSYIEYKNDLYATGTVTYAFTVPAA